MRSARRASGNTRHVEDFSGTVGFWADMDDPYVTYDNTFIVVRVVGFEADLGKGPFVQGFKIVPYCPRCGTPLSSHEVAQAIRT